MPDPRSISEDVEAGRGPSSRAAKDIEAGYDTVAGTPKGESGGTYGDGGAAPVVNPGANNHQVEPLPAKGLK